MLIQIVFLCTHGYNLVVSSSRVKATFEKAGSHMDNNQVATSSSRHHSPACCFLFSARHTIPLPTWPPSKSSPKLSSYRNIFVGLDGVGPGEGRDPWTWRSLVVYLHPLLHNYSTRLVRAVKKWRTAYCCQLYFQPKPRNWLDKEIMQPTQRHWIIFPNRRRLTLHRTILP